MLKKRIVTALWGIPLIIAAIWFKQPLPWFTLLIAVWGALAVYEFYRLVADSRVLPLTYPGLILVLILIISRDSDLIATLEPYFNIELLTPAILVFSLIISLILLPLRFKRRETFTRWIWTATGMLYVGLTLGCLVSLRGIDSGRDWVFYTLFVTFASDTSAFFTGRAIGRHKLAPRISPGKTWEGAAGGICGAVIISLLFTIPSFLSIPIGWGQAIILGLLVSLSGQLGDLTESWYKRTVGVKDSGKSIPGHGGFLDRIDSLLFASVVVYCYVLFAVG